MFRSSWIWPTLRRAKVIPLLMARVESVCHILQDNSSNLVHALHAIQILCLLSQEYSFCCDILSTKPHTLLTIANNTRLIQMARPDRENHIRRLTQGIQFSVLDCIKNITTPRPQDDSLHIGTRMSSRPGWNIETTWNWLLQTMLALKLLPDEYIPGRQRGRYSTGLHILHHLILIESNLRTQQKDEAWLLLRREEISDLYAHLICAQLYDTDRSASLAMATVLEGHTQAVSQIIRDDTANDETIYLSLPSWTLCAHEDGHWIGRRQRTCRDGYMCQANWSGPMVLPKPYEIRNHYHAGPTPQTQQNGRLEQQGDNKLGNNQRYNGNPPPHNATTTLPSGNNSHITLF